MRGGASGQSKRVVCEEKWSHRSEGVKEASVAPVCGGERVGGGSGPFLKVKTPLHSSLLLAFLLSGGSSPAANKPGCRVCPVWWPVPDGRWLDQYP